MRFPDARILIFARAPRPGRVKTRLIPVLGGQGACAFHAACLRHTLERLGRRPPAPLELWVTDTSDPLLGSLAGRHGCGLRRQQGDDLGQRMWHAAREALGRASRVVLVGTDVPLLDSAYLETALQRLEEGAEVVMGPAEDGGYVLLGLGQAWPELFDAMPWGSDKVAERTRQRCRRSGLRLEELPLLWDIDRPQDLWRLERERDAALLPLQRVLRQHLPGP